MKKSYLFLVLLFISRLSFGQPILDENFDYGSAQDNLINVAFNYIELPGTSGETPYIGYSPTSLIMPDYEPITIGGLQSLILQDHQGKQGKIFIYKFLEYPQEQFI